MAADATLARRRVPDTNGTSSSSTHSLVAAQGNNGSAWHRPRNGSLSVPLPPPADKSLPLASALRAVEASGPSEWVLHCVSAVLEHPAASRLEVEVALARLVSWLAPPAEAKALALVAASSLPMAVINAIRRFRNEPPAAALACVVVVRCSGSSEGAAAHVRAGAMQEVGGLMDSHPSHGGVQNVCLLLLCALMKDGGAARQAVSLGAVGRVLRAMEATAGREVQYNGCVALRLLADGGRAPRVGLQEAVMRAKVAHQSDDAISGVANDVLAIVTPRFKEVLCWHWQSGWCKLGPRCTYAHGPEDLRGG